jgi:tellurite resistance protein TerC
MVRHNTRPRVFDRLSHRKALAVDNIFVFAVIFSYFAVPIAYQHRVLFWGILGALVLRAIFIVLGAALLQKFHWIMYLFGVFLILTGIKLLLQHDDEIHPERNPAFRLFKRMVRSVSEFHGGRFFLSKNGKWYATPLLLVLVSVEVTDVIFALDSIPAICRNLRPVHRLYFNIFAILARFSIFCSRASCTSFNI